MDALNTTNGKVEKSNLLSRFHHLQSITKLLRIIELRFLLIFLTWVPYFVKISGDFFRQLLIIVISPLFIFILSNIIVLALLFQSSHLFPRYYQEENESDIDLYEEFIINNDYYMFTHETPFPVQEPVENIVYQDKKTIYEEKKVGKNSKFVGAQKVHRRSHSVSMIEGKSLDIDNCKMHLQRLQTAKCWKVKNSGETVYMVDKMSNEEFQKAIEDFISRQIKFHREEKLSVVRISSRTEHEKPKRELH